MTDLTTQEQENVRGALLFLRTRCGGWKPLTKALRFQGKTLLHVSGGSRPVSASMAVRVARLASVSVDDVLTGKYPAQGTCPHCGYRAPDGERPAVNGAGAEVAR